MDFTVFLCFDYRGLFDGLGSFKFPERCHHAKCEKEAKLYLMKFVLEDHIDNWLGNAIGNITSEPIVPKDKMNT